jgi:hypothetical protein
MSSSQDFASPPTGTRPPRPQTRTIGFVCAKTRIAGSIHVEVLKILRQRPFRDREPSPRYPHDWLRSCKIYEAEATSMSSSQDFASPPLIGPAAAPRTPPGLASFVQIPETEAASMSSSQDFASPPSGTRPTRPDTRTIGFVRAKPETEVVSTSKFSRFCVTAPMVRPPRPAPTIGFVRANPESEAISGRASQDFASPPPPAQAVPHSRFLDSRIPAPLASTPASD